MRRKIWSVFPEWNAVWLLVVTAQSIDVDLDLINKYNLWIVLNLLSTSNGLTDEY